MSILLSSKDEAKITGVARTDAADDQRSDRAVAVIIALAFLILGVTVAYGVPGDTIGTCCFGGGRATEIHTFSAHMAHQESEGSHPWEPGVMDPVTNVCPCDGVAGAD